MTVPSSPWRKRRLHEKNSEAVDRFAEDKGSTDKSKFHQCADSTERGHRATVLLHARMTFSHSLAAFEFGRSFSRFNCFFGIFDFPLASVRFMANPILRLVGDHPLLGKSSISATTSAFLVQGLKVMDGARHGAG